MHPGRVLHVVPRHRHRVDERHVQDGPTVTLPVRAPTRCSPPGRGSAAARSRRASRGSPTSGPTARTAQGCRNEPTPDRPGAAPPSGPSAAAGPGRRGRTRSPWPGRPGTTTTGGMVGFSAGGTNDSRSATRTSYKTCRMSTSSTRSVTSSSSTTSGEPSTKGRMSSEPASGIRPPPPRRRPGGTDAARRPGPRLEARHDLLGEQPHGVEHVLLGHDLHELVDEVDAVEPDVLPRRDRVSHVVRRPHGHALEGLGGVAGRARLTTQRRQQPLRRVRVRRQAPPWRTGAAPPCTRTWRPPSARCAGPGRRPRNTTGS